jgi:hypothetical protein
MDEYATGSRRLRPRVPAVEVLEDRFLLSLTNLVDGRFALPDCIPCAVQLWQAAQGRVTTDTAVQLGNDLKAAARSVLEWRGPGRDHPWASLEQGTALVPFLSFIKDHASSLEADEVTADRIEHQLREAVRAAYRESISAALLAGRGPEREGKRERAELAALAEQHTLAPSSRGEPSAPPLPGIPVPSPDRGSAAPALLGRAAREEGDTAGMMPRTVNAGRPDDKAMVSQEDLECPPRRLPEENTAPGKQPLPAPLPLLGRLSLDLEALKRGTDQFFARLARLAEFGKGLPGSSRLLSWITLATALALEFNRRRQKKPAQQPLPGNIPVDAAALPEAP